MSVCCCSLAGTAACQHCSANPFATDVWTNKTVTVDHLDVKPIGNGLDVCPVCGKPSTIGKPITNADRIRSMTDEELARWVTSGIKSVLARCEGYELSTAFEQEMLDWLREEATDG